MSRPVHMLDSDVRDYTLVGKDPWVFEFRVDPQEMGKLRLPRALLVTRRNRAFAITDVKRVPGPPVDGEHLVQVTATMVT